MKSKLLSKHSLYKNTIRILDAIRDEMVSQGEGHWLFAWDEGEVELRIIR